MRTYLPQPGSSMLIHQVIDKVESLHGLHVSAGHLCLHMLGMISGLAGVFRAENDNAASRLACRHLVWKKSLMLSVALIASESLRNERSVALVSTISLDGRFWRPFRTD